MSFPLLKLPFLALIDIIQRLNMLELISVGLSSMRARRVVRCHAKLLTIVMKVTRTTHNGFIEFGINKSKMITWRREWNYGTDTQEKYKNSLTFLADTFKVASAVFEFLGSTTEHFCQLLELAKSHRLRFEEVHFSGAFKSAELSRRFMTACRDADTIEMVGRFKGTLDGYQNLSVENLKVHDDGIEWVRNMSTLINCSNVSIDCSCFDSQELNRFLKSWMQGMGRIQSLKMKRTDHGLGDVDVPVVMDGIDREVIRQNEEWRIQRHDGTRSRICVADDRFEFTVLAD